MKLHLRDLVERVILCAFGSWLIWRILSAIFAGEASWVSAFVLVGEVLVLYFVLTGRPATDVSTSPREWALAFAGSAAPLLVSTGGEPIAPPLLIVILFLVSIIAQLGAKLSLNRSFGMAPANRGVVTKGLYAYVRHPVYASYLIGHVAFLLANPTWWNACVYAVGLALQVGRMNAEEGLLTRDPAYAAYRERVRYRLAPGVY
jgi:protein-S-isoprenylcysteine O-methyltransferase Ste14